MLRDGVMTESTGTDSVASRERPERTLGRSMRIAIVYDCLFPNTVGGAERWYRSLAERLGQRHSISYLTRRQWGEEGPQTPFRTLDVGPGGELYTSSGRRRIWPPLRFGIGVFLHLVRHGRRYDAVHSASFPYFSLLAAALALRLVRSPARLIVDWHEVWGREYWRSYLGPLRGRIGFAVERLCLRVPDRSFTFSRLAERRLLEYGHRAPILRLTGEYADDGLARQRSRKPTAEVDPPLVVAAGRHIPEKRIPTIPAAVAAAQERIPDLRCLILGEGPDTEATRLRVRELGLEGTVEMPGRVGHDRVMSAIASASCLLHPSEREGYGLIVVEAVSLGTPAIVVRGPENAATDLIEADVNGFVVEAADPATIADAIVDAVRGGSTLRASTLDWYRRHRDELSIESSLARVEASYSTVGEG
jgi:glycosyltransferase involved in cell wall biosynthesis